MGVYRCRLFSSHLEKQNNTYRLYMCTVQGSSSVEVHGLCSPVVNTCGQRVAWRDPHLLHLLQRHSAAWPRSPAPRFKKWDLQWEQCGAQLCLQDFRDDIITPEAEQSGATGRQRDVSSAIHQGQLIQHQHWAHCGAMQCTSLSFFLSGFFFSELLFEE